MIPENDWWGNRPAQPDNLTIAAPLATAPGRVDAARQRVEFEDGTQARYDLLIEIPPQEAPKVVRDAQLVNQSGWTNHAGVTTRRREQNPCCRRAMKAEGSFFQPPHPVMEKRIPDEAQFREKLDWIERLLRPVR